LSALVARALIQVDAVAFGTVAAKEMAPASPKVTAAAHVDVFAGLMKLSRRSEPTTHPHLLHPEIVERVHLRHHVLCTIHCAKSHILKSSGLF
jgi:hypothetical protein